MPANNDTTTKWKVDISDLKKSMQDAQRQIRLANAEFKAASAGMDNWRTSTDGLTAKITQLKTVLGSQKTILDGLKQQYQQVAAAQGADSKAAQELQIKIANQQAAVNSTEKALNDYERELQEVGEAEKAAAKNGTTVEQELKNVGKAADEASKETGKASEGFTVMKGVMANLVTQGIQLAAKALKDLGKEMVQSVKDAAAFADNINTLAKQTGIGTKELQEFTYMSSIIDVSVDTMSGSMAKLTRNMANAQKGTGDAKKAFEALGITVTNTDGSLRSNQDVFQKAIAALGKMENETQRDAYAMQIFGRSAQDLNPLIEAGADTIAELTKEAHNMGYVMDQETLDSLNEVQDSFDRFGTVLEGTKRNLVSALGPGLVDILSPLIGVLADIPNAIKEGDFSGIIDSLKKIFADGLAELEIYGPQFIQGFLDVVTQAGVAIMEEAPALLSVAAVLVESLLSGLEENLPVLISALPGLISGVLDVLVEHAPIIAQSAIDVLNAVTLAIADALPQALPTIARQIPLLIKKLLETVLKNLPAVIKAGTQLFKGLLDGLVLAIPELVNGLQDLLKELLGMIQEYLPDMLDAAIEFFMALVDSIPIVLDSVITALPDLIRGITEFIVGSIPLVLDAAISLLMAIIDAIPIIIESLISELPSIISTICSVLVENLPLVIEAAFDLLFGIISAIPQIIEELILQLPSIITTIVTELTKPESIAQILAIGPKLVYALWDGIADKLPWLRDMMDQIENVMPDWMREILGIDQASGASARSGWAPTKSNAYTQLPSTAGMPSYAMQYQNSKGVSKTTTVNFQQTINSPKAVSQLEVYRQTNNALNFTAGVASDIQ